MFHGALYNCNLALRPFTNVTSMLTYTIETYNHAITYYISIYNNNYINGVIVYMVTLMGLKLRHAEEEFLQS